MPSGSGPACSRVARAPSTSIRRRLRSTTSPSCSTASAGPSPRSLAAASLWWSRGTRTSSPCTWRGCRWRWPPAAPPSARSTSTSCGGSANGSCPCSTPTRPGPTPASGGGAAAEVVARHPDAVTRHEYGVFVSRRTGVDLDVVVRAIEAAFSGAQKTRPAPKPPVRPLQGGEKAEGDLLRLLRATHPGVRRHDLPGVFSRDEHRAAFEVLAPVVAALDPGMPPDLGSLLGDDDSEVAVMLRGLAFLETPLAVGEGGGGKGQG